MPLPNIRDLTDEQWQILDDLISEPSHRQDGRGRPSKDRRAVLNGILWVLRTGALWADLPERYPSYQACHRRFHHRIWSFLVLPLLLSPLVLAQGKPPEPRPSKAGSDATKASEGMTKDQADALLAELKQIRQLLEKQQLQLVAAMAPKPAAEPAPPEKVQMRVDNGWYAIGRADAPVTLVEFGDYQCPFCKQFHTAAYADLKKNYIDTGKVRFVSRDLPLDFHPFALRAAEATRCAADQGKYWEVRDALLANSAPPSDEIIKKTVENLSLDTASFQACLDSDQHKAEVQKDASEAVALQISGTPTFVLAKSAKDKLDGVRIVGAQPFATFQSAIEDLLTLPAPAPTPLAAPATAEGKRE